MIQRRYGSMVCWYGMVPYLCTTTIRWFGQDEKGGNSSGSGAIRELAAVCQTEASKPGMCGVHT